MSRYDKDPIYDGLDETDGGEASPRPLKSRRLVDMMEDTPRKGTGTGRESAPFEPVRAGREIAPRDGTKGTSRGKARDKAHGNARGDEVSLSPSARTSTRPRTASPKTTPDPQIPPDVHAVLSVTPSGEGETVTVVLAIPDPAGGKPRRVSFCLLVEQYANLVVKEGEITPEGAEALLDAGRLCGAIRRGISMLGYGDQSARRLAYKLTAKGVDRDTAERAVAYLTEKGYIHEDSTATLRAEQGIRKGWGARRICEDLGAHGFTREAVEEAMEAISQTDWEALCASVIRKKYRTIPEERGERQKLMAAMMRLGYSADTVKEALRRILRDG